MRFEIGDNILAIIPTNDTVLIKEGQISLGDNKRGYYNEGRYAVTFNNGKTEYIKASRLKLLEDVRQVDGISIQKSKDELVEVWNDLVNNYHANEHEDQYSGFGWEIPFDYKEYYDEELDDQRNDISENLMIYFQSKFNQIKSTYPDWIGDIFIIEYTDEKEDDDEEIIETSDDIKASFVIIDSSMRYNSIDEYMEDIENSDTDIDVVYDTMINFKNSLEKREEELEEIEQLLKQ